MTIKQTYDPQAQERFIQDLDAELQAIRELLIAKNKSYGDSVLNPVRIFSKASPEEQLKVRVDDKLSRLAYGDSSTIKEDVTLDLIGYLLIMRIAESRAEGSPVTVTQTATRTTTGDLSLRIDPSIAEFIDMLYSDADAANHDWNPAG